MNIKCITFDKQAQDALPEEIKAKMKADREKAIMNRQLKKMEALSMQDIGRVILYRGQKEVSKEWVYGFLTVKPSYGNTQAYYIEYVEELYKDGKFNGLKHHSYSVIPETIGQFTGLTYNGKEVYEDDIISLTRFTCYGFVSEHQYTGTVEFRDGSFIFCYKHGYSPFSELEFDESDIEIIGNIYDRPELLND